ncbi:MULTISPECIES: tRNA (adenosine(37)-N6)-threonylcarbamoyltransferase complex ATPase subunit type 1 TsaE [unclassified Oleiphilus]|jgi:tRNA threonylcarbamoyladenosine biosynthesis protein TsaE|uniref:tRNA (adenosine(37)-N6)-threonylcarbamoyltransferase complex ATPase subunit type 1 TsaE n=2 Tax=Oleiphilus TaxID=141450 RepID=UPI0007C3F459|nr:MULTISPECIES: tRNA (adenosine(37)-N6)-threonylcarbamoyltransferase complex ATPase subunit type 1 TsaE [unclassified Oleiphilus]KZY45872.1 hypothetical protein A3732_09025 [Oleiphilus sp. HI0050]KZY75868.1 hypothetical protein A3740_02145 [Oleiphilus sp. HI0068]KZY77356.1 hypothetical protein A3741_09960 [Oleiphilus sp. HI0069]KZY90806.1 hypothetical protein A3743_07360 [Oleiphilus sp. HI0072]KZZ18036.1 hypothetical protein A3749_22280 [Oleiphilus sp. HI0078]
MTKAAIGLVLVDESATVALGRLLFSVIDEHCFHQGVVSIFLHGDLGMGKTTLTRGILEGAGHFGKVKSPTYTIVEPYELQNVQVNHFDLYRLGDPEELEFMGVRDYFEVPHDGQEKQLCVIEWPDKGQGFLPEADFEVDLSCTGRGRLCKITADGEILSVLKEVSLRPGSGLVVSNVSC